MESWSRCICRASTGENLRRFRERSALGDRHLVHPDAAFTPDYWENFDGPVGLGPVVELDTTGPVDIERTAGLVRALIAELE